MIEPEGREADPIHPQSITERGVFIPKSVIVAHEGFADIDHLLTFLGAQGLHATEVDPSHNGFDVLPYDPETEGTLGLASREEFIESLSINTEMPESEQSNLWNSMLRQSSGFAEKLARWQNPLFIQKELARISRYIQNETQAPRLRHLEAVYKEVEARLTGEAHGVPPLYREAVAEPFMVVTDGESGDVVAITEVNPTTKRRAQLDVDAYLRMHRSLDTSGVKISDARRRAGALFLNERIHYAKRGLE